MYQSIVDKLKISAEDLLSIDEVQIIKFEKILKSQTVLDNTSLNAQSNSEIIATLKDIELRKFFYIIEKHPKLKSFLSKGKPLESQTLSINQSIVTSLGIDIDAFRLFLEPYFVDILIPKLKDAINRNQFLFVLDKIKNNWLFSEDIKFQCQKLILNKISTTIHLLETSRNLKDTKYIRDNGFGTLIKYCSYGNGLQHLKMYVETLVKQLKSVHSRSKRANHYHHGLLSISNANMENDGINRYVEAHINNHVTSIILDKKTPDEWGIQVLLTIAVLTVALIVAMILKSYNKSQPTEKYSAKDVTSFYKSFNDIYRKHLTRDANGVLKNIEGHLILKAYKYPYNIDSELMNPIFFPFFKEFPKVDSSTKHQLTIENLDSEKSLIVFRKNNYNHCQLLRPRSRLTTFVAPNDSLIFYRGKFLNISDYGGLSTFNGIYKHSSKADRLRFFQVYIVDAEHNSKSSRIQMKNFGELKFQNIKTTITPTSYVGKNIIDVNILESYLD